VTDINVTLKLRQAAAVRDALFRSTAKDSYEFPGQRTVEIREAILILDEKIEESLNASENT
tara:strand:+ start:669 stop:851 length:183 start_codon:yes stop_codon:yes gene_type:complete